MGWARRRGPAGAALAACLLSAGALAQDSAAAAAGTAVELTIVGGPALNPGAHGTAAPVLVRIFALGSAGDFAAADYETLFGSASAAFGTPEEFLLHPGDIQHHDRTLAPPLRALGIAAAFRDLEGGVWRLVVPLSAGRHNLVLVALDGSTIRQAALSATAP